MVSICLNGKVPSGNWCGSKLRSTDALWFTGSKISVMGSSMKDGKVACIGIPSCPIAHAGTKVHVKYTKNQKTKIWDERNVQGLFSHRSTMLKMDFERTARLTLILMGYENPTNSSIG